MATAVSLHAFGDASGNMGRVATISVMSIKRPAWPVSNGSVLFWVLQQAFDAPPRPGPAPDFAAALAAIDMAMQPLAAAQMQRPDAGVDRGGI